MDCNLCTEKYNSNNRKPMVLKLRPQFLFKLLKKIKIQSKLCLSKMQKAKNK